jgi:hypothetical protein
LTRNIVYLEVYDIERTHDSLYRGIGVAAAYKSHDDDGALASSETSCDNLQQV